MRHTHPEVESANLESVLPIFHIGSVHDVQSIVAVAGRNKHMITTNQDETEEIPFDRCISRFAVFVFEVSSDYAHGSFIL